MTWDEDVKMKSTVLALEETQAQHAKDLQALQDGRVGDSCVPRHQQKVENLIFAGASMAAFLVSVGAAVHLCKAHGRLQRDSKERERARDRVTSQRDQELWQAINKIDLKHTESLNMKDDALRLTIDERSTKQMGEMKDTAEELRSNMNKELLKQAEAINKTIADLRNASSKSSAEQKQEIRTIIDELRMLKSRCQENFEKLNSKRVPLKQGWFESWVRLPLLSKL